MKNFNKFNLDEEILKSLNILDYKIPTKVQEDVIPFLIDKNNILIKSKTGTGKSASFAIPICNQIKSLDKELKALIIVPTRELALQVKEEIEKIGRLKRIKCSAILGKESLNNQVLELKQGINVVVATPGRMIDHISRGSIELNNLDYFVIDEVDKMFTKGFKTDIDTIIKNIPETVCKAFFSATVGEDLKDICDEYMKNYKYIEVSESENIIQNEIIQQYIEINDGDTSIKDENPKYKILKSLLYKFKPETVIVFTNTKKYAEILCENMKKDGFLVEHIHGDISQERRFYIIDTFKKHEFNILISSDIISRGIHIDDVSLVVNYDIPSDREVYVHRIGRTGRAGKKGRAVSLVSDNEYKNFEDIQNFIKQKIDLIDVKYTDKDKEEYQLKVKNLKEKLSLINNKEDEFSGEVVKIHINLGKKKKIRIGDIVGALNNIDGIENEDLGVIKIYDSYSTVDILNKKGTEFLKEYSEIIVKNKKAKIKLEK